MDWQMILETVVQIAVYGVTAGLLLAVFIAVIARRLRNEAWFWRAGRTLTPDAIEPYVIDAAQWAVEYAEAIYGGIDKIGADHINEMIATAALWLKNQGVQGIDWELLKLVITKIAADRGGAIND